MELVSTGQTITTNTSYPGRADDWRSISFAIGDLEIDLLGVNDITYYQEQLPTPVMGVGPNVVKQGMGNVETSGSISIHVWQMKEILDAIALLFPSGFIRGVNRNPLNIAPFTLIVYYDKDDGTISKDLLYGCRFTRYEKTFAQGDANGVMNINLAPTSIGWDELVG